MPDHASEEAAGMRTRPMDWRIAMGIVITVLWILAGLMYLAGGSFGRMSIYDVPLENLGSFLEGAFAPLAFLWLVIGLFVQQKELADNTEVLRQTSIQSEKQTQAIAATELNARQETFFKIADNVKRQLGSIAGMLFVSSLGESQGGTVPMDRIKDLWHMLSTGDHEVFAREFLTLEPEHYGGYEALFYGTEIRRRHTRNYCSTFDRLLKLAANCDSDGIITDALTQTGNGLLYNVMRNAAPDAGEVRPAPVDASRYEQMLESERR